MYDRNGQEGREFRRSVGELGSITTPWYSTISLYHILKG